MTGGGRGGGFGIEMGAKPFTFTALTDDNMEGGEMAWYSISINSHNRDLFTLIYTRNYALLKALLQALKRVGYASASEEPVEGWLCAYCGEVNKDMICRGCRASSPVPIEEKDG